MDHAISTLRISLENAQINERVMRGEGRTEEADACRARAESYIEALAALDCIRGGHLKEPETFEGKLARAINCHSRENGSNTPDFILAEYLKRCLDNFDLTVRAREQHSIKISGEDFLWDLPETAVYEKPLPDGIPQPPEGFAYVGLGPLKKAASLNNPDIAGLRHSDNQWDMDGLFGDDMSTHYAVRIGSEVAKANGIHA